MWFKISFLWVFIGIAFGITDELKAQSKEIGRNSLRLLAGIDSVRRLRDSLEVTMLRQTHTYEQIELIIQTIHKESTYIDLLPCVLPVDLPIEAFRITSPFGIRKHPVLKKSRFHGGIDVKASNGRPVKATASGFVVETGYDVSLGAFVRLQHSLGFETIYGHLSGFCVRQGQCIERNEEIGRVGQSGLTTGPHLHYCIKKNGSAIDPFQFCFLLRRRLWLIQSMKPVDSGTADSPSLSVSSLSGI